MRPTPPLPAIYVCSPFRAPTPQGIEENIKKAVNVSVELAEVGFYPLCPHLLSERWPKEYTVNNDEFWLGFTLEVMLKCDVVYACEGWKESAGCCNEISTAVEHRIPTARSMGEAVGFFSGWQRALRRSE